jgi:uncharacterized delta-60 repeat protein
MLGNFFKYRKSSKWLRRSHSGQRPPFLPKVEVLENRTLLNAGELDPTFALRGLTLLGGPTPIFPRASALQSDGKILVVGTHGGFTGAEDFDLVRINPDGIPDGSFGSVGEVITDFGGQDYASAIDVGNDGKIIVAGTAGLSFYPTQSILIAVARYNSDGSLDTSFGSTGKVLTAIGSDCHATAVAILPDHKILVAGTTNLGGIALVRYNLDGSLDQSFGSGGEVVTPLVSGGSILSITSQQGGKIILVGSFSFESGTAVMLRYGPSGGLDESFGVDGKAIPLADTISSVSSMMVQSDGSIMLAGASGSSSFVVTRFQENGSPDTSFGINGSVRGTVTGTDGIRTIALESDGHIVAAGSVSIRNDSDFILTEFNADGSLDTRFGNAGTVVTDFGQPFYESWDYPQTITLQPNGRILVVGTARFSEEVYTANYEVAVARYLGTATREVPSPATPHLQAGSDTGPSDHDGITRAPTAVFDVTQAEADDTVFLYRDGHAIAYRTGPGALTDLFSSPSSGYEFHYT